MSEVFNSSVLDAINRAVQDGISTTALEVDGTPQYCIINAETREIEIPGELNIFGVESDEKSTRVYFRCPKYVGTNVDLDMTKCMVYVPYRNANGEKDQYIVTDLNETEDGENVEFTWLISRKASAYMGITEFGIRAIKTATGGTIEAEWNTTVASANVIRGMDVGLLEFSEENIDAIAQAVDLVKQEIELKGQETIATIPDDYTTAAQNALSAKNEVEDIREGYYGTTYKSAGEAVRKQIESIFSELNDAGLIINIDVEYETHRGTYIDFNGIIRNIEGFSISNFVEIPPSITKILYRNVYVNPYVSGITFFREPILDNSQILTHIQYTGTDNTITDVGMCEIPEEAKYVVFSNNVNSVGVVQSSGIYKFIQNTPTKISDLENDVGFITKDDLPELKNNGNTPSICIGSKLYAVVGDTLQVFYNSIIEGYSEEFILRIQCEKGKCFPRFWEYTPVSSDVGTVPLVISIYYLDGTLIEEKNVQLIIKQANNPSEVKNILCIGDSTMQGGQIPIESSRRLKGTTGVASQPEPLNLSNFKFVGRLQNLEKTVGWEGTGGWGFNTYLNKNGNAGFRFEVSDATTLNIGDVYQIDYDGGYYRFQLWEINVTEGTGNIFGGFYTTSDSDGQADSRIPQNGVMNRISGNGQETVTYASRVKESYMPFWNYDTDEWDIKQYVEKYCEGKVDYIIILLGINSIIGMDAFSTDFSRIIDSAKTLLRNIHSQIPEAKVLLSTLAPVSVLGGIGSNYGSSGIPGQYSANGSNRKVFEYNKELFKFEEDSEFNEYVTIVSAHSQFDAYTGYPWTEKHLVTRYSDNDPKEYIQTNAVHPSNQGYWMISDGLCFRSLLCMI